MNWVVMSFFENMRCHKILFVTLLWLGLTTLCHGASLKELKLRLDLARQDLRISEATEARIASELKKLKNSGHASPEVLEDYEIYLGRVQEMVLENRKIVQELEALYARYAPRTESASLSASSKAQDAPGSKLPNEEEGDELVALDREFHASLTAFDEMLLKEMDEIRSKSASKMKDLAEEAAAVGFAGLAEILATWRPTKGEDIERMAAITTALANCSSALKQEGLRGALPMLEGPLMAAQLAGDGGGLFELVKDHFLPPPEGA